MTLMRPFDQSGNVSQHKGMVTCLHHAQVRLKSRKRIVSNLRFGCRKTRNQRRLAGIGKSDEADIGEQFQLETDVLPFTRLARLNLARRAVGRRREPGVAQTAAPAARDEDALAFLGQVGDEPQRLIGIARFLVHERADRYSKLEIVAGVAGPVRSLAMSAARHPFFAPERKAAASSAAGLDVNVYFVNKHKIGELMNRDCRVLSG